MRNYLRLAAVFWISLIVLAAFPFTIKTVKSQSSFIFEGEWGGFVDPSSVAADNSGNFFVVDAENTRVQGFDNSGTLRWVGETEGVYVEGFAFSSGAVYVTAPYGQSIYSFSSTTGEKLWEYFFSGFYPGVVAVDDFGTVYVAEFDPEAGGPVGKYVDNDGVLFLEYSSDAYDSAVNIAFDDASERVYLAESGQVQVLSSYDLHWIDTWVLSGFVIGGIAVDDAGDVYLTNKVSNTVSKFTGDGVLLDSWGGFGSGPGLFNNPSGVAVDGYGSVYVADTGNDRIQKFSQFGEISVNNVLDPYSPIPLDDWSYTLFDEVGTPVEQFLLPAEGGGSILFSSLPTGTYSLAQIKKYNYGTDITVNAVPVQEETLDTNKISVTLNVLPGETAIVDFSNALIPDAAFAKKAGGGDPSTPSMMTYSVPCGRAIPVQVTWDPDIQPDGKIDLVKDKPTKILVNLSDALAPTGPIELSDSVTIFLTSSPSGFFDSLEATTTGQGIKDDSITIFDLSPPSIVGDYTITCTIIYGATQASLPPKETLVSVKETFELALYYSHLSREGDYGTINTDSDGDFDTMLENTRDFINAVYPVPNLIVDSNREGIAGQATQPNYLGMLKDCQYIAQQAKLRFPNSPNAIGVAIGPDLQSGGNYKNYFAYHGAVQGKKTAVGVSFGPGVKGVVVLDGYYSGAAHEIGHTFGLYYGVPEQYVNFNPGLPCNGYWAEQNEWRSGYDFMGLAPYQSTASVWVNTDSTFEPLFSSLKTTPNDPQILLVNGIIYEVDGVVTVELPYTWYSLPHGTPDTGPEGERFALRFTRADGSTVETSFDAQFSINLDPGIAVGEDLPEDFTGFGTIDTNFAGFALAVEYPEGTVNIELLDKTKPAGQQVITTVSPDSVQSVGFGSTIESCDSTGATKNKFDLMEEVYVIGNGYLPSTTYDLYVVVDEAVWSDGMTIPARVSGTATTVSSDAGGNVQTTLVWSSPLVPRKYDIVVDVNGNGQYDAGIDALDDSDILVTAGFFVIPETPLGTLMASLAMTFALACCINIPKIRKKIRGGDNQK